MTVVSEGVLIQETLGKVPSWREIEVWRLAWDECRKQTLAEAERLCRENPAIVGLLLAHAIAKLAEVDGV
jgi:hypothetical protein